MASECGAFTLFIHSHTEIAVQVVGVRAAEDFPCMASRHASCWCTLRPVTAIHVAFRAEGMSIGPSLLSSFEVPFGRDANPDTGGKLPEDRESFTCCPGVCIQGQRHAAWRRAARLCPASSITKLRRVVRPLFTRPRSGVQSVWTE